MKIGILIDSGGAIVNDKMLTGTDIHVIPLHVILEDKTEFLDTTENIKTYEVFNRVSNKENITTSMASPGELETMYDKMLEKYDHIIHLTITPNLSGMKDVALMVARDEKYQGKVSIIDHHTAANGIKYTALKMQELINQGETNIAAFQKIADRATNGIFLGLIPGDIKKLNKGGRGKGVLISLLKVIKTQFLIKWGEKPKNIGLSRTIRGIIDKALDNGFEMSGKNAKVILVHTVQTNQTVIENAEKELKNQKVTYETELIPSIYGCHAGTETIGIIMIPKDLL